MSVVDFRRGPNGEKGAAELGGVIQKGDFIIGIDGKRIIARKFKVVRDHLIVSH